MTQAGIHEIFKVPIYSVQLDLDIKKLQSYCKEYENKDNVGRIRSNVGGYQSNDLTLDDVSLQSIIKEIETYSTKFAEEILYCKQVIMNMWFNVNRYKDSNQIHSHPGTSISGTYYIKTPKDCGVIEFEHPGSSALIDQYNYDNNPAYFNNEVYSYNAYNASLWWLPVTENILYLFPAWLKHRVKPNNNKNEERISMSFNTTNG